MPRTYPLDEMFPMSGASPAKSRLSAYSLGVVVAFVLILVAGVALLDRVAGVPVLSMQIEAMLGLADPTGDVPADAATSAPDPAHVTQGQIGSIRI